MTWSAISTQKMFYVRNKSVNYGIVRKGGFTQKP